MSRRIYSRKNKDISFFGHSKPSIHPDNVILPPSTVSSLQSWLKKDYIVVVQSKNKKNKKEITLTSMETPSTNPGFPMPSIKAIGTQVIPITFPTLNKAFFNIWFCRDLIEKLSYQNTLENKNCQKFEKLFFVSIKSVTRICPGTVNYSKLHSI